MNHKIFIVGTGGIGEAVGLLLREWSGTDVELFLGDISEERLHEAVSFISHLSQKTTEIHTFMMNDDLSEELKSAFEQCDVLLDCAPGAQAPKLAGYAKDFKMHYVNLTEYVAETDAIMEIGKEADTAFVLQTGLAPGFINVLAMSLYKKFVEDFGNEKVERIAMKVGALTAHAHSPHYYGFTWSPIGVSTEYVKNSRVIRDYAITELPALSERERIIIGGRTYEADLTSGGAADLPDYFEGKAKDLDYKTLRHVGHYRWAEQKIAGLEKNDELPDRLLDVFLKEIPAVEDDFVLVHASVDGFDSEGTRRMLEKSYSVEPMEINGHYLRAIQTTTAVPMCEAAMMVLEGDYKGVILQSELDQETFLNGSFVSRVYR